MLSKFGRISTSWSFVFLLFATGLATIAITNMVGATSAASAMTKNLLETREGLETLKSFAQVSKEQEMLSKNP